MKVTLEGNAEDIRKVLGTEVDESNVAITYENDEQHTFKVGEKARLIKLSITTRGFSEGEVVRIVDNRISPEQGRVAFSKLNNSHDTGFADPADLEPIKQLTRREIVEKAKADVADIIAKAKGSKRNHDGNYTFREKVTYVKFNVNREKRTVAALIYSNIDDKLLEKGIAKVAPDDVFNVDIGKAISAHRAYGLDVPDEYLNAPKPEGVAVGDTIISRGILSGKGIVTAVRPHGYGDWNRGLTFKRADGRNVWTYIEKVVVIDDSDRNYDVAE
jgi:hypothetical protein